MRKYFFIGAGGVLGAIARYMIEGVSIPGYHGNVPLNTLLINVTGSFLLALILTVAIEIWEFDSNIRLGLTTGFLGAYTTFSALCKETAFLLREGFYFSAVSYMSLSALLGLASAYFGIVLAREAVSKLVRKGKRSADHAAGESE